MMLKTINNLSTKCYVFMMKVFVLGDFALTSVAFNMAVLWLMYVI